MDRAAAIERPRPTRRRAIRSTSVLTTGASTTRALFGRAVVTRLAAVLTIVAASLVVAPDRARAAEGQGPVTGDVVRIEDLSFGEHWFGPELSQEDLVGKVVLVEMWGS